MKTKKKSGWMKGFIIPPRITDPLELSQQQARITMVHAHKQPRYRVVVKT